MRPCIWVWLLVDKMWKAWYYDIEWFLNYMVNCNDNLEVQPTFYLFVLIRWSVASFIFPVKYQIGICLRYASWENCIFAWCLLFVNSLEKCNQNYLFVSSLMWVFLIVIMIWIVYRIWGALINTHDWSCLSSVDVIVHRHWLELHNTWQSSIIQSYGLVESLNTITKAIKL